MIRVADAVPGARTPAAVVEACAVCLHAVYVDRVTIPDPPGETVTLVCTVCALENPDTRPQVINMVKATLRLRSVLPSAAKGQAAYGWPEVMRHDG